MSDMEEIARYVFEAGMLKRVARSGWWAEGIKNPESVADHSFRAGVIAFILAKMEGLDDGAAERLCTAAVFHDVQEARLTDLNKIAVCYVKPGWELGRKVEEDQAARLPPELRRAVLGVMDLSEKERAVLKDADQLECAFQAKEYYDTGCKGTGTWIGGIAGRLRTRSAKGLLARMRKMDSDSWWKGLKKLD